MFTIEQLKAAHSKVKTGADFPAYVQEIKLLGLIKYEYLVADGSVTYYGENGYTVSSAARYAPLAIAQNSSAVQLRHNIAIHQQGQTDFATFCSQAADAGVKYWEVNTGRMLCIYYNSLGDEMVAEPIPQAGY